MGPTDYYVMHLHGADYLIPWDELPVGGSFFLPTTGTANQVMRKLRRGARAKDYILVAHARREFGRYGVRVWRTF
jgi:hypothetical protein